MSNIHASVSVRRGQGIEVHGIKSNKNHPPFVPGFWDRPVAPVCKRHPIDSMHHIELVKAHAGNTSFFVSMSLSALC